MTDKTDISRRQLLHMLLGAGFALSLSKPSFADDDGESEDSGSDDGGGDDDNNGDGDSGGNSGPSASLNSNGAGSPNQLPIKNKKPKGDVLNQDEVQKAIADGNAASLALLLAFLKNKYPGKVLDVKLRKLNGDYRYEVKLLTNFVLLHTLTLDAKTLAKL